MLDATVSRPAHGDQKQNGSANEGAARDDHNLITAHGAHDEEENSEHSHHDNDDAQRPGRLQVRAEGHGVVDFTLHLSRASLTSLPDSLPYGMLCSSL